MTGRKPSAPIDSTTAQLDVPLPAGIQEETDAIVAVVPRSCRANARWAVPLLLSAARSGGITHLRRIAYLLATAQHTSQFGAQLVEPATREMRDGQGFEHLEPTTPHGAALGNVHSGDGERFRGRGFVYIRGRCAYALWSQRLGMPDQDLDGVSVPFFVAHPSAMAQPGIAAQTLVRGMRDGLFTGIALGSYVNDKKTDFYRARRVIDCSKAAREVAAIAETLTLAIEELQRKRHSAFMQQRSNARAASRHRRDFIGEVREAVDRLAKHGEILPWPTEVSDWNGEARQGKFLQLDEHTYALHIGRGAYITLDVQRDLNGLVPPLGRGVALKRSGDVRL